jgi:hypothetical protein
MSKKRKKQKYCPYCQHKQRTIDRLENQLRDYEMQRIAGQAITKPFK